jgi:MSHA biogenesis protein MshG
MHLLIRSGVPIISGLNQLAEYTRSRKLAAALKGVSDNLEKGKSLSAAMSNFPNVFSPLIINIINIGENTGHLSESFAHLHEYLNFEAQNRKMIKSTFRYPVFVVITILAAITVLNIFVIPTFSHFYINLGVALPWETQFLIGMSNIFTRYGLILLICLIAIIITIYRYIHTSKGNYKFSHFLLRLPIFGKLYRRLILIRFSQSLAITLNSGVPVSQGLTLVKNSLNNKYIEDQIVSAQELIERGNTLTQAMSAIELFSPLENQIIAVGEKNGELGNAMEYIGTFQSSEIEFDIKRLNDNLGPILIALISGLVLIVALGIYLPVWNMINLVH